MNTANLDRTLALWITSGLLATAAWVVRWPVPALALSMASFSLFATWVRARYVWSRTHHEPVGPWLLFLERTRQYIADEGD